MEIHLYEQRVAHFLRQFHYYCSQIRNHSINRTAY